MSILDKTRRFERPWHSGFFNPRRMDLQDTEDYIFWHLFWVALGGLGLVAGLPLSFLFDNFAFSALSGIVTTAFGWFGYRVFDYENKIPSLAYNAKDYYGYDHSDDLAKRYIRLSRLDQKKVDPNFLGVLRDHENYTKDEMKQYLASIHSAIEAVQKANEIEKKMNLTPKQYKSLEARIAMVNDTVDENTIRVEVMREIEQKIPLNG